MPTPCSSTPKPNSAWRGCSAVGWWPPSTGCVSSSRSAASTPGRTRSTSPRKRGVTWLNMISDQAMGLTGRVLSGTPRDTLHFVDLVYDPHGGPGPEVLITDQGSYSGPDLRDRDAARLRLPAGA